MTAETERVDEYMDAYRIWKDANEDMLDIITTLERFIGYLKTPGTTAVALADTVPLPGNNIIDSTEWPTADRLRELVNTWRETAHVARELWTRIPPDRQITLEGPPAPQDA